MAHRFSNTGAQREAIRKFANQVKLTLTSEQIQRTEALTTLDCYGELAHELATAIVAVVTEERPSTN